MSGITIASQRRRLRLWGIHVSALIVALMPVILLHNRPILLIYVVWMGLFALHTVRLVQANRRDAIQRNSNLDE